MAVHSAVCPFRLRARTPRFSTSTVGNARRRACASSTFRPSARMRRFLSSTLATRTSSSRVVSMPISSVQSLGPAYSSSRRRPAVIRASVLFQQPALDRSLAARQLTAKRLASGHFGPNARLSTTAALLQYLYYAWHDNEKRDASLPVRRFLRSRAPQRLNARLRRARDRRQASSRFHIFD